MAQSEIQAPHIQNNNFRMPEYLPVCQTECAGDITNPDRLTRITRQNTYKDQDKNIVHGQLAEDYTEGRMFAVARNAALGFRTFKETEDNEPFLAVIPSHVVEAARACARTILADSCPKYYVANGSVRIRHPEATRQQG